MKTKTKKNTFLPNSKLQFKNDILINRSIFFFSFVNYILDRAPSEERRRDPSIFPGSLSTDGEGKKTI